MYFSENVDTAIVVLWLLVIISATYIDGVLSFGLRLALEIFNSVATVNFNVCCFQLLPNSMVTSLISIVHLRLKWFSM